MIRLARVDDHPAIAAAIAAAIRPDADLELVGTTANAPDALVMIEDCRPDVLICDLWLDGQPAGLDVLAAMEGPSHAGAPRVLILSGFDQPSFLRAAFEGGAAGYLSKASSLEAIIEAVRTVAGGGSVFPAVTLRALRDAPRRPSDRELSAIRLLAEGASNDEIATGLGISVKTVESHLRRLFGRYGVLSRTELAMLAVREGWIGTTP